ncbi:MAG TPA: hypothetical protein VG737_03860 [Cyclobacteriaceae bacterium]|nr:hypothetical protein [Cyclobacteriaceae bacterium]
MKNSLALLNIRTFVVVAISLVASVLTLRYNLKINNAVILFGILVVFPLVKSFQFAFKRREKSLEYLSLFKGGLIAVHQFFHHSKKLVPEHKAKAREVILRAIESLLTYLKTGQPDVKDVYARLDQVSVFMKEHREELSGKNITLIIRQMRDVYVSTAFLVSMRRHRTVAALRAFALVFIAVFPLVQAPILNNTFEGNSIMVVSITCLTGFILATLFNVQHQLENPFDQIGHDDIKLDDFRAEI